MSRNQPFPLESLVAVAAIALGASGAALADDSSMSQWTGDSYAYFNNLDYSLGKFNVARAPMGSDSAVAKSRRQDAPKPESRVLLATRPSRGIPASPFSDDKGA